MPFRKKKAVFGILFKGCFKNAHFVNVFHIDPIVRGSVKFRFCE
jgi:hypothetical protein